jgi:DNA-binding GntR family transcriptional regulator
VADPQQLSRLRSLSDVSYSSKQQTATDFVRGALRRAILSGELRGGERLVQAELAELFDVSTTPVREALRDLTNEGLVRFDRRRGAIVGELGGEELHEIFMLRELLAPVAIRLAVPRITDQLIARLRELNEKMAREPTSADWVDDNRTFHTKIYDAADSPRLSGFLRLLEDASVMYIASSMMDTPSLRSEAIKDHSAIIDALELRDADAAIAATLSHLDLALQAYEAGSGK